MKEKLPKYLIENLENIYSKEEIELILKAFNTEKNISFRVLQKDLDLSCINFWTLEKVDFLENSYILKNAIERQIWDLEIYKSWKIYLQSVSSQIPVNFFSNYLSLSSKERGEGSNILDATAAPWWKTSQLSQKFPNAKIYAFERSKVRFEKMLCNLKKMNIQNVIPINDDVCNLQKHFCLEDFEWFDYVLVDAPCSSEGKIKFYNEKSYKNLDEKSNKFYYNIQKNILNSVIPYLKIGGELIYSTCTISPLENEWISHFILSNFWDLKVEEINLSAFGIPLIKGDNTIGNSKNIFKPWIKSFWKTVFRKDCEKTLRILPSEITEWFYIAKFKKYEKI